MKVICISGKAGCGKDTAAVKLREILWGYGRRVLVIHNADLLKHMCKNMFGWNGAKDERGRTILQYIGTDVVRAQEPNFWVDHIIRTLKLFPDQWDYVLIPDCRFPNEIDRLAESGFDVIHMAIARPGSAGGLSAEQQAHASETALDGTTPDIEIKNDGSVADLTGALLKHVIEWEGGYL